MQPTTPEDWAIVLQKHTIGLPVSQLQAEWNLVAKACIDRTGAVRDIGRLMLPVTSSANARELKLVLGTGLLKVLHFDS